MSKRIWILRDYYSCSGCRLCEIACSEKHEGLTWPEASRIRVVEIIPGIPIPVLCVQCPDYPCISSCPTKALRVDDNTGAVIVDEGLCTLCGNCVEACPGSIPRIVKGKSSVVICDLCGGEPACVNACSEAGYNALKTVKHPGDDTVKHYLANPMGLTDLFLKKINV